MTNSVQRQGPRIAAEKRTPIDLTQPYKSFSTKARMNIKTGRLDGPITSEQRFETIMSCPSSMSYSSVKSSNIVRDSRIQRMTTERFNRLNKMVI